MKSGVQARWIPVAVEVDAPLLRQDSVARGIDRATTILGRLVSWLIVAAIAVSAGNAAVRKAFDMSSNAWLELQWWMFGAVFLLAAPWTLRANEHIRIDVVSSRLGDRWRDRIDVLGHTLFLLPVTAVVLVTSWPFFVRAWLQNEQSSNAGGLPQWPAKALIPIAFAILLVQGLSEIVKRLAIMRGTLDPDAVRPDRAGTVPHDADCPANRPRS